MTRRAFAPDTIPERARRLAAVARETEPDEETAAASVASVLAQGSLSLDIAMRHARRAVRAVYGGQP
jgi:hypothetical protein